MYHRGAQVQRGKRVQQQVQWRPGPECLTSAEGVDSSKRPEPSAPPRPPPPVSEASLLLHRLRQTTPGTVRLITRTDSRGDTKKAPLLYSAQVAGVVL